MADPQTADLVILGGGSGGYACALRAAELGLSVVMIEKDKVGGTCLHRGCIPTKALLHAAEVADAAREGEKVGVQEHPRGHRHGRRQQLQGRRRRPALQGPDRAGEEPQHHRRRGQRAAGRGRHRRGRRHPLHRDQGASSSPPARTPDRCPASRSTASGSSPATTRSSSTTCRRRSSCSAAASSAWSSPASGSPSAPTSRSSRRCPTWCPTEDESSSKLLERAFRRRGINFSLGVRFASAKVTDTGVTVTLEDGKTVRRRAAAGRGRPRAGVGGPRLRRGRASRWTAAS